MKTKKMSLANIQGKLSRVEMKKIMAGSDGCSVGKPCWNDYTATTGHCMPWSNGCFCQAGTGASVYSYDCSGYWV